ncbi:DUF3990 domain-containing protein [Caproicibacter sp. BJN0012]|uniref:DUF3990 domain-containing protein n=1 Tax=Caproicibacter sp. BJN0012 TaxID=3110227 RepID=UPI002E0DDECA
MIIYHGSDIIVSEPKILQNQRLLDFGVGFYTTTNQEQAARWAKKVCMRRKSSVGYISVYELDMDAAKTDLIILRFPVPDAQWLDFICACRSGRQTVTDYDMVIGPVADDNVYITVKLFETGVLDKEEAVKRLKVEKLFNQVLFHTEKALSYCTFQNSIVLEGEENG